MKIEWSFRIAGSLLLALAGWSGIARAADSESCGDVLRYASRDVTSSVTYSDLRKAYYNQVCTSTTSSGGLSFGDASIALGLSYSSKDDYCQHEQSWASSTNYSRQDASLVVSGALTAYVQCRALSRAGINTYITVPPTDSPAVFSVQISRSSATPVSVSAVRLSDPAAVSCSAAAGGQTRPIQGLVTNINYALPQSDARWSLSCTRKGTANTTGTSYNPVQLIVSTTQGDLPVAFSGVGLAANVWANTLRGEITAQINSLNTDLNNLASGLRVGGGIAQRDAGGFSTSTWLCPAGSYMVAVDYQLDGGGPHGITSWLHPVCRKVTP
jgi:hypothetical protein